jgi:hypothetical protein
VKSPLTLTLPLRGGRGGWGRTIRFLFYATLRSIKDLKILLIVNLVPKDILAVVSSAKNVKYMISWSHPRYSWHASMLSILISYFKKIEPSPFPIMILFKLGSPTRKRGKNSGLSSLKQEKAKSVLSADSSIGKNV